MSKQVVNTPEGERVYFVEEKTAGIFVTDKESGLRFFQTRSGGRSEGWFWLCGPGNPFGEDVALHGEDAEYFSDIVEATQLV